MLSNLRFVLGNVFAVVVVVWSSSGWPGSQLPTAHLLLKLHLVVLALLPYAQIVRVCPLSEVSCPAMPLLLWLLLWFVATFEGVGCAHGFRLLDCDRLPTPHHAPRCRGTSPACANRSNMLFDLCFTRSSSLRSSRLDSSRLGSSRLGSSSLGCSSLGFRDLDVRVLDVRGLDLRGLDVRVLDVRGLDVRVFGLRSLILRVFGLRVFNTSSFLRSLSLQSSSLWSSGLQSSILRVFSLRVFSL
jgi:hypothetical protein